MKKSPAFIGAAAAMGILLLILDGKTALTGAIEGLTLCIRTVIPSLFPFFLLSILLTGSLMGTHISLLRPVCKTLGVPCGAESILAAGFLGGYPVGAQSISTAFRRGQLTHQESRRMLAFCNNAGPAFLFGIASSLFPYPWMAWALWGIHILSALLVAVMIPGKSDRTVSLGDGNMPTITNAMTRSLLIMAQVCGWVILFRVVIAFLEHWFGWLLPFYGQVVISGILELSNGCCALAAVENIGLRFVLCSGFLAFGGLCVGLQTMSVAEETDIGLYFPGKVLQTLFSISLAMVTQCALPSNMVCPIPPPVPILLMISGIFPFFLNKIRNISRNSAAIGV